MDEHLPKHSKYSQKINLILSGFLVFSLLLTAFAISEVRSLNSDARGKPSVSTAILRVTPNPVPLGSTSVVISGTGFRSGESLQIITGFVPSAWATADSSGSFSVVYDHDFTQPDSASMQAWSTGRKPQLRASVSYTVQ